jgi:hypothetical protein
MTAPTSTNATERTLAPALTASGWQLFAWAVVLSTFVVLSAKVDPVIACRAGEAMLIFAFAAAGGMRRRAGIAWQRTPLDGLFAAWLAASVVWVIVGRQNEIAHPNPYHYALFGGGDSGPFQFFLNEVAAFAAFYLAMWTMDSVNGETPPLAGAFDLIGAVIVFLCAMEAVVGEKPLRLEATFHNTNLLASFVILILPPIIARTAFAKPGTERSLRILLSASLVLVLVFTHSRAAEIGMVVAAGMIAVSWAGSNAEHRSQRLRALAVGAAIAIALTGYLALSKHSLLEKESHAESDVGRVLTWKAAAKIFESHPLVGVGFGGFPAALHDLHVMTWNSLSPNGLPLAPLVHVHAHDIFLQVAAERGVIGLVLLVASLIVISRPWVRAVRLGRANPLALGMAAGLAAWFLQNLVDFTLWQPAIAVTAFIALGSIFRATEVRNASQYTS